MYPHNGSTWFLRVDGIITIAFSSAVTNRKLIYKKVVSEVLHHALPFN